MQSSPPWLPTSAPPIRLDRHPGRLRGLRHLALLGPALLGAWVWLGLSGAIPVLVWWWHIRPRVEVGPWLLDLSSVKDARLGPWRVRLVLAGGSVREVFRDELSAGDLARLRRLVKFHLLLGGGPEDVEPV